MGFHIAMTICTLILPLVLLGFGAMFKFTMPINPMFGYRTSMSMKNDITWNFAHRFIGKLWMPLGAAALPPSILTMIFLPDGTEDSIGAAVIIVMIAQLIIILASVTATEIALHRHFDKNGNPK